MPGLYAAGRNSCGIARSAEAVAIPLLAVLVAAALFSIFLLILGQSPLQFYELLWIGGFGTSFSWTNTLWLAVTRTLRPYLVLSS